MCLAGADDGGVEMAIHIFRVGSNIRLSALSGSTLTASAAGFGLRKIFWSRHNFP